MNKKQQRKLPTYGPSSSILAYREVKSVE